MFQYVIFQYKFRELCEPTEKQFQEHKATQSWEKKQW